MSWTNYHSHTHFSDGSDSPSAYVKSAILSGMKAYGFSCHAPVPFENSWAMKRLRLGEYLDEITKLKGVFASSIQLFCSLEVDYIPGIVSPSDKLFRDDRLDYIIGSVHFVDSFDDGVPWGIDGSAELFADGMKKIWHSDVKKAANRYYSLVRAMITESKPQILGHIDKFRMHNVNNKYFSETEDWYRDEVFQTLEVVRDSGSLMEVNTRGMYRGHKIEPYPSLWILNEAAEMGIGIVLSSDAHKPNEITRMFSESSFMLRKTGYNKLHCLENGSWQSFPFDEAGF